MGRAQQLKTCSALVEIGQSAPSEFRIWKAGSNPTANGYAVLFDAKAAADVMASYVEHGVDVMIDLEHMSIDDAHPNWTPDALGWCSLEVRAGELWAVNVRWTPEGARRLSEQTQRYISPTFYLDEEKRATRLVNIALVARPATHEIPALVAKEQERKTMVTSKQLLFAAHVLAASAFASPHEKLHKLAEGDSSGEVGGVNIAELASFLMITADPSQDPAGFVRELQAKLDEISSKLRGDAAPAAEPEATPAESMNQVESTKALLRLCNARDVVEAIVNVADWRKLAAEHAEKLAEVESEKRALHQAKVRKVLGELQACGAETPASVETISGLPLAALEKRLEAFKSSVGVDSRRTPLVAAIAKSGLTDEQLARCKAKGISPEKFAATLAGMTRKAG